MPANSDKNEPDTGRLNHVEFYIGISSRRLLWRDRTPLVGWHWSGGEFVFPVFFLRAMSTMAARVAALKKQMAGHHGVEEPAEAAQVIAVPAATAKPKDPAVVVAPTTVITSGSSISALEDAVMAEEFRRADYQVPHTNPQNVLTSSSRRSKSLRPSLRSATFLAFSYVGSSTGRRCCRRNLFQHPSATSAWYAREPSGSKLRADTHVCSLFETW